MNEIRIEDIRAMSIKAAAESVETAKRVVIESPYLLEVMNSIKEAASQGKFGTDAEFKEYEQARSAQRTLALLGYSCSEIFENNDFFMNPSTEEIVESITYVFDISW